MLEQKGKGTGKTLPASGFRYYASNGAFSWQVRKETVKADTVIARCESERAVRDICKAMQAWKEREEA